MILRGLIARIFVNLLSTTHACVRSLRSYHANKLKNVTFYLRVSALITAYQERVSVAPTFALERVACANTVRLYQVVLQLMNAQLEKVLARNSAILQCLTVVRNVDLVMDAFVSGQREKILTLLT